MKRIFSPTITTEDLFKVFKNSIELKQKKKEKEIYKALKKIDFGTFIAVTKAITKLSEDLNK